MRTFPLYVLILFTLITSCKKDEENPTVAVNDSITMGAGYANDIYYSFATGIVKTQSRTDWDIAFFTEARSSAIMVNCGAGEKLFTYPLGDTSVWNTNFDLSGISEWKTMYNSDTSWIFSAFEAHTNLSDPFDYGWGTYNSLSHDVVADSLYVLKLANGSYKKIWIVKKVSVNNVYYVKVADTDGQNEVEVTIDCKNFSTKNFAYYNVVSNTVLDREPVKTSWDIVFTKYVSLEQLSMGNPSPVVTGVLLNRKTSGIKVSEESVGVDSYTSSEFSDNFSIVGYDWKAFNGETFTYSIVPDRKYFIKTANKEVYKLVFKGFAGSTSGNVSFEKKKVK
jgi:hypothetical protein